MAFRVSDGNAMEQILELAAGYGIGGAVGAVIAPVIQEFANNEWVKLPVLPTEVRTLAALARMEAFPSAAMEEEARQTGVGPESWVRYLRATLTIPDASALIELARRGEIDPLELITHLQRAGIDPRYTAQMVALVRSPLSPQDAAMARQQGFITDQQSYELARLGGVTQADSDLMFELSGLPPGPEQMIELWRRGEVSEDRVRQAIIEGHIKLKYTDDVMKLRYQPLSASIAAEALIRERISVDEAVAIAEKNGIRRDDFLTWSNMLGRPIATGEALTLARRGQFTKTEFREAVARSDVRTEYTDHLWELRTTYPSLFQIVRAVGSGSVTDELAISTILKLGQTPEWAHALVDAAHATKHVKTKDLAAGQVDQLYESGLETRGWAKEQLVNLGYSQEEADWHLELLEAQLLLNAIRSALNLIHHTYVARKIDEGQASDELTKLGVRPEVHDLLLDEWTNERNAVVLVLTNAQIGRALKLGILDEQTAIARWMNNGYSQDDATVLARLATHVAASHNPTAP